MKKIAKCIVRGDEVRKRTEKKHPQKVFAALFAGVHDICVYTHNHKKYNIYLWDRQVDEMELLGLCWLRKMQVVTKMMRR